MALVPLLGKSERSLPALSLPLRMSWTFPVPACGPCLCAAEESQLTQMVLCGSHSTSELPCWISLNLSQFSSVWRYKTAPGIKIQTKHDVGNGIMIFFLLFSLAFLVICNIWFPLYFFLFPTFSWAMFSWHQPTTKEFSLIPAGNGQLRAWSFFFLYVKLRLFSASVQPFFIIHLFFFFSLVYRKKEGFSTLITDKDLDQYWSKLCEFPWK